MEGKWLNFYLRYSTFTFKLKQKIVEVENLTLALPYAVLLIFSELGFAILAIPLYIAVPPKKLQERGLIFPSSDNEPKHVDSYAIRRRISLGTLAGVGGIWVAKVAFVSFVSIFFLGVQQLLAYTQNWDFSTPADYTFDGAKLTVVGGFAQLTDQGTGGSCSGTASTCTTFVSTSTCQAQGGCSWGGGSVSSTVNRDFTTNTNGWAYSDWQSNARVNGVRVTSGGNPGAYINVTFTARNNDTASGYWEQPFTTTGANPTASLNFDWSIPAYSSNGLTSFVVYVFVDNFHGAPTLGSQVWSQPVVSSFGWLNSGNIDVSSKVTSAGTYYLKLVARRITASGATGINTAGFDNVVLNWSNLPSCSGAASSCSSFSSSTPCGAQSGCSWGTTPVYPTSSPAITPNFSLAPSGVTAWNTFTETASKGTGEIYYQLSSDDGVTWKYWAGSAWATSTTSTNRNTASVVNTNIGSFSVASGKVKWKAFLTSSGSQVSLDNVSIGYTQNDPPSLNNLSTMQDLGNGRVYVGYDLVDAQSDTASLVAYEYSLNGTDWSTMTAIPSDPGHSGVSSLSTSPTGVSHIFVWNARNDLGSGYFGSVYVRMRANDGIVDGSTVTSLNFSVDYAAPVVSSVTATQVSNSSDININYNLTDNTPDNNTVDLQISSDGGSTWNVATTSLAGDVGNTITVGNGKSVTWHAGIDFGNQENGTMMVALRARDKYQNQGAFVNSAVFSLDNKAPSVVTTTDLLAQPLAGASAVLVGGSFNESNPDTNELSVALNGGSYGSSEAGDTHTATPANKYVSVPSVLTGIDRVSAVKIVHTDTFGHMTINENTLPSAAFRYVKPYTPPAPTVSLAGAGALDVTVNKHASEADGLEYAIYESFSSSYVQADGTLGASPHWQNVTTTNVSGLSDPVSQYVFSVKSRNTSDNSHAESSESDLGGGASYNYQSPVISISSAAQTTNGTKYVVVSYTGTDNQNASNNLSVFEFSIDGTNWQTMTEKAGVGDGKTSLPFTAAGRAFTFAWDVGSDLPNAEDPTVYVRLRSNDGNTNSNLALSAAFPVDTASPFITNIFGRQSTGVNDIGISYDLSDGSSSNIKVVLAISDDSGTTYSVSTSSVSGDVGAAVNAGVGRNIVWRAGTDLPDTEKNSMRVKLYAQDSFGNSGQNVESGDFSLDTKIPVISAVSADQTPGSALVSINYTLTDLSTSTILFEVSNDSGATWTVPTSTRSGDVGPGMVPGTHTFSWDAVADYPDADSVTMRVRVRGVDMYGHIGVFASSGDFTVNTRILSISNITAIQNLGSKTVTIHYDLNKAATTTLWISADSGATWTVSTSTITGDIGPVGVGNNKTVTWNPGLDYNNEESSSMRVRMRGVDSLGVPSAYYESANFSVDTAAPLGLATLARFAGNVSSVTMQWSSGVIDSNFDHYELWHGANESDVIGRTGSAAKWSVADDAGLQSLTAISTVITGINVNTNYFAKIWAVDRYGNESTIPAVNVYVPTAPVITVGGAGGGTVAATPLVEEVIKRPVLSGLLSPTSNGTVVVSGLAKSGSKIDIYDNGVLVSRLVYAADVNGRFNQTFEFGVGEHVLTAKAIDGTRTSDVSDPVYLRVVSAPEAPVVLSHKDGDRITDATPKIIGAAAPLVPVEITIDDRATFMAISGADGSFELSVPSSFALRDGIHDFALRAITQDGKRGPIARLTLDKYTPVTSVPRPARQASSIVAPPSSVIREVVGATEISAMPVPQVSSVRGLAGNQTISFSGTALPNKDIVVYIHSDQALVYRTRSNESGIWTVDHSQAVTELAPGDHTVYAVALDPSSNVKSRPSPVAMFTVTKNIWVSIYQSLNLQTTVATLAVLISVMFWFYLLKRKGVEGI